MGSALLRGWLAQGLAQRYLVVEPGPVPDALRGHAEVAVLPAPDRLPPEISPAGIVLAVKPQAMAAVLPA